MLSRLKFEIEGLFQEIYDERLPETLFMSETTTFADLQSAGLQSIIPLVNKLRKYGHSDENIRSRVFAFIENDVYLNYVQVKNPDLPVTFDIYKKSIDMKFDVIVGNPPYQRNTSKTHKLWVEFLKSSFDLSNQYVVYVTPTLLLPFKSKVGVTYTTTLLLPFKSKVVVYVTPTLLLNGNSKRISDLRKSVLPYMVYCDFDVNKFFNVSESIVSYIIDKSKKNENQIVVKNLNGKIQQQEIQNGTIYTDEKQFLIQNIIKKIENCGLPKLTLVSDVNNTDGYKTVKNLLKDGIISKSFSDEFCYEFIHSGNQKFYTNEPSKFGNGLKVVINFSSSYEKMFITNGVLGKQVEGILVDSLEEGEKVITTLTSKMFKFFIKHEKSGGFNSGIFKLPSLDFHINWTDESLYEHFNFTDDEIKLIDELL